ncbi:Mariner Mos1 transposase-like Protein [Tribolium castaneum]|uniref:Mariner Mos1 transposase-like Protein n=1 Tax=Tribolium castaneum TaxID=7070 RepID=A0A139W9H7_TRICA|nr:Mariner Mos1 transposase-like Protein [Tribolium castaneum]
MQATLQVLPAGKLEGPSAVEAMCDGADSQQNRLFITDQKSRIRYLVDTGAEVSVVPKRLVDYLEKGKTINGPYYASLLDQLKQKIQEKRPGLVKKKILFHQDNAPCHKSVIAMEKINELGFELVPHAPYSPDLAPSDFNLFPNLKKFHAGKKYGSDSEVIVATNAYFDELDEKDYRDGIKGLEHRWTKCIQLEGDYVEK